MRNSTLLFLVKRNSNGQIEDICLAMKKRGFGTGRWNGVGGKVSQGESIEAATAREANEEIAVTPKDMNKVAELAFAFPGKPDWDQLVHAYLTECWDGEPTESEEMAPKWFKVSDIPYSQMWPDDVFWLPKALAGEKLKARFAFGDNDAILEQKVESVSSF